MSQPSRVTRFLITLREAILRRRHRDIRDELAFHLSEEAEAARARGLSDDDARAAARRDLGNPVLVEEDTRAAWGWIGLERTGQDVRYALRMVRRRPAFAAAAIVSLALGIGANTAVFSLLHALLLERLPVARPGELVRLSETPDGGVPRDQFVYTTYDALRRGSRLLSSVVMLTSTGGDARTIEDRGGTHTAVVQYVSDNYFDAFGIGALDGQVLHERRGDADGELAAVISEAYWARRYASQPDAIGKTLLLGSRTLTIAGIAAKGFTGVENDRPVDVWVPFEQIVPRDSLDRTRGRWIRVMGRLAPGVTTAAATAESTAIVGRAVALLPGATGYSNLRRALTRPLLLVEAVVALVLLITCANLANLMMAATAARERELAVRRSLGASHGRVIRQLFTESLVLSLAAGVLAVFVARVTSAALLGFLPPQHAPALAGLRFAATPGILGFVAGLCCASCAIVGLAPALRLGRGTDVSRLRVGVSTGHQAPRWMSRTLVIAQVAMCTLLLMLAGVFLRTLGNLRGQDTGYREGRLMVADVWAPREDAEDRRDQLIEDLRGRIAVLPGVDVASFSNAGQLSGNGIEFRIGFPDRPWHADDAPLVFEQRITPGFLSAMGTILIAGRDFTTADDARATPVAVVNRAFASRFFPGIDPVGRRFFRSGGRQTRDEMEIIGVVQSSKWVNLRDEPPAMYYRPYAQMGGTPRVRFAIRANGDLEALAAAITSTALSVDRDMTVENVVPFSVIVDRTLVVERLVAQVSSAFGLLALATAGVGLYGLLAYGVARRRREIGVRMALGATAGAVEWMILGESLALFSFGCAIGVPLALVANRQASSMLYGLTPGDPLTVVLALVTLGVVTAAASYVPARRAATIDPMLALRDE